MGTNKVGENNKKLRTESGLSQKEVAQAIGRSGSQIGAYENGYATERTVQNCSLPEMCTRGTDYW